MKTILVILAVALTSIALYAIYPQDLDPYTGTVGITEERIEFTNAVRHIIIKTDDRYPDDILLVRFHTNSANVITVRGAVGVSRTGSRLFSEIWIAGTASNTHYEILTQETN